jgi:AraC-like DNA-binding protein
LPPTEVAASIGAMIVHAASAAGVDAVALAAAAGFDPSLADDPDARIPLEVETRLWDEAARRSGDSAFGLHTAALIRPGMFDVLDYAIRTAPTLRAALDRLARYNRLVHDTATFRVSDDGQTTRVEHALAVPGQRQSRHAAEFTLAAIAVFAQQLAGAPLRVRRVDLAHPAPGEDHVAEHARVFGVVPQFGTPVNALDLDRGQLLAALPAADPSLSRVIERHAEALLAARPEPREGWTHRVRRRLADAFAREQADVSLPAVAAALRVAERTLQRWLADEGTSFDALVDDARRELAHRYLADRGISIAEVAYLLGYSEPSSFHRAFKRWTGITPAEHRRRAG